MKFEEKLEKLQDYVIEIETNSEIELEELIDKFNKAMELAKDAFTDLKNAKIKVNEIIEKNSEFIEKDIKIDY